jgi:hypothetical protein
MKASTTTLENIIEAPLKAKYRSAIWSSNSTPRDIVEGIWLKLLQKHLHTHVYCITIYNSQAMETAKMPPNQMDQEMWYLYTMEFYLATKKKRNFVNHKW